MEARSGTDEHIVSQTWVYGAEDWWNHLVVVSLRIAGMLNFPQVKLMIRGLRGALPLTCSQTAHGYGPRFMFFEHRFFNNSSKLAMLVSRTGDEGWTWCEVKVLNCSLISYHKRVLVHLTSRTVDMKVEIRQGVCNNPPAEWISPENGWRSSMWPILDHCCKCSHQWVGGHRTL